MWHFSHSKISFCWSCNVFFKHTHTHTLTHTPIKTSNMKQNPHKNRIKQPDARKSVPGELGGLGVGGQVIGDCEVMLLIKFKSWFEIQICTTGRRICGEWRGLGIWEADLIGLFDIYVRFFISRSKYWFYAVCQNGYRVIKDECKQCFKLIRFHFEDIQWDIKNILNFDYLNYAVDFLIKNGQRIISLLIDIFKNNWSFLIKFG